ncbi:proteasome subunit alpha [Arthrobacter cryoconiti]|uniref:Proteasome subunit alpha n=1 Tax=Arthrobacter cryoconiti TaxID=748907 RepID=A0ABV8R044_9MICC|nr:proteasome subunit alpha [Arthrobacter cryoconiti]MCC9069846.1 proteasome subunit alpha [Arthrobacter cryoconiti]
MSAQFYVSPEQMMKDRADFARKGIARGKSVVVMSYADGIALVAENVSPTLHKIGEIYDRIGFAAVGKYNEFESLRQAGVRYADVRGYSYDRADVSARGLASVYAQSLGTVFTTEQKPFEVELAVAEVSDAQIHDHIFRINFDGSISEESGYLCMGGQAENVAAKLAELWVPETDIAQALAWAVTALQSPHQAPVADAERTESNAVPLGLGAATLEVAVLERNAKEIRGTHRTFRRLSAADVATFLPSNRQD